MPNLLRASAAKATSSSFLICLMDALQTTSPAVTSASWPILCSCFWHSSNWFQPHLDDSNMQHQANKRLGFRLQEHALPESNTIEPLRTASLPFNGQRSRGAHVSCASALLCKASPKASRPQPAQQIGAPKYTQSAFQHARHPNHTFRNAT